MEVYMTVHTSFAAAAAFLFLQAPLFAQPVAEIISSSLNEQPASVAGIIADERSIPRAKEILALAEEMDSIYGSIYKNALSGKKFVIFIDPAHGMVNDGSGKEWQGALTWRKSTTGIPEELYSIAICRKFYKTFSENPHFEVTSTPDFLEVMKGNADVYDDVSFDTSVALAKKCGAAVLISEHLNNVAPISKADGFVNIQGLHITCDRLRTPYLSYVNDVYKGYYTAYNVYDITGSSRSFADSFRDNMTAAGHQSNKWENGSVADDRFSIYINFPFSVLFESGFISNPAEEAKLRTDEYQQTIAQSQYNALLATIKNNFGADLSHSRPASTGEDCSEAVEAIKLSRIFVLYTQCGEFSKAAHVLTVMEKRLGSTKYSSLVWPYSSLRGRLNRAAAAVNDGEAYARKRKMKKSALSFNRAIQAMGYHPLFNGIRESVYDRYNYSARRAGMRQASYNYGIAHYEAFPPELQRYRSQVENHSFKTPFILTINEGQSLDEAIELAVAPRDELRSKVSGAVHNGYTTKKTYVKTYSKKKKKYIYTTKYVSAKAEYYPGVYIISFGKNMNSTSVQRANNIPFNPKAYQNQQFFKNSCLAEKTKERSL